MTYPLFPSFLLPPSPWPHNYLFIRFGHSIPFCNTYHSINFIFYNLSYSVCLPNLIFFLYHCIMLCYLLVFQLVLVVSNLDWLVCHYLIHATGVGILISVGVHYMHVYLNLLYFAWVDQRTLQCYLLVRQHCLVRSGQYSSAII